MWDSKGDFSLIKKWAHGYFFSVYCWTYNVRLPVDSWNNTESFYVYILICQTFLLCTKTMFTKLMAFPGSTGSHTFYTGTWVIIGACTDGFSTFWEVLTCARFVTWWFYSLDLGVWRVISVLTILDRFFVCCRHK